MVNACRYYAPEPGQHPSVHRVRLTPVCFRISGILVSAVFLVMLSITIGRTQVHSTVMLRLLMLSSARRFLGAPPHRKEATAMNSFKSVQGRLQFSLHSTSVAISETLAKSEECH